jgi:DNA-directed RNA polymerase subunit RPC12/RpoP
VRHRPVFSAKTTITITCPRCSKRLGELWADDEQTRWHDVPPWDGFFEGCAHTRKHSPSGGYTNSIRCGRCGFDWRGHDRKVGEVVHRAAALGLTRTALPTA